MLKTLTVAALISQASAIDGEVSGMPGCRCLNEPFVSLPKTECSHPWVPEGDHCVTVDQAYAEENYKNKVDGVLVSELGEKYGSSCRMHLEPGMSECYDIETNTMKLDGPAWCYKSWCYVDPCQCTAEDIVASSAFGSELTYSYATCGSVDSWTNPEELGSANCPKAEGVTTRTDDPNECAVPSQETLEIYMPYHEKTVTLPPVPTEVNKYSYATDNAMVAIPEKCAEHVPSALASNFMDRQPGGPTGMYYMRVSSPTEEYGLLQKMGESGCAAGLVILLHGTTGFRWNPASYSAMMSGLGYIVVGPDSHAMPADMGFKGAESLKATADIDTSNYCGSMEVYNGRCGTWAKPLCYSTKDKNILEDRAKYKQLVERSYLVRKLELDYFVQSRQDLIHAFDKVFLFGRSEGAMVASRYYNEMLHPKLSGLILSGWSCEFNYFVSCAEHVHICENKCSKTLPIVNINGDLDAYFGAEDSVSSRVAANKTHGYGAETMTGSCRKMMDMQNFRFGTAVTLPSGHSILYSHDNALRSVFADFLASPDKSSDWHSIQREGCKYENGIYECDALYGESGEKPCVSYKTNPNASFVLKGASMKEQYPMTCGTVKEMYRHNKCCGNPAKKFEM